MPTLMRAPRWIDAIWLTILALYILAGAAIVPFHGDESTLLYMGGDFHILFVERDLGAVFYDEARSAGRNEQRLRLMNGTVSKTLYGWLSWLHGLGVDELNRQWRWMRDFDFNREGGSLPAAQLLRAARLASAAQLALAVAFFFHFVRLTLNRPTALLACTLFALHPNVLINGRRAMMEGSHLLGLMLVLLAGAWLLRERRRRTFALAGACMGLAVAAKHPNVIVCALVFMIALAVVWWRRQGTPEKQREAGRHPLLGFGVTAASAMLVFLLFNPAWWSAPLAAPGAVVSLRAEVLENQVKTYGGYADFTDQLRGFFRFVFAAEEQYFEVADWANYAVVSAEIDGYERSGLAGLTIGGAGLAGVACMLLALIGGVLLAGDSTIAVDNRALLLCWVGGAALAALVLTPLPWARYYLPLAPALSLLVSIALVNLASLFLRRIKLQANGFAVLA